MVLPGSRTDTRVTPGATRSGLACPSWVGPRLEKGMITSSDLSSVALPSIAPTVTTKGSSPGLLTVPASGPRFPAAVTTSTPELQTCSTA